MAVRLTRSSGGPFLEAIEGALLEWIRSVYETIGWTGVVVLMAIESANLPVPSELIMPLSGWFLVRDAGHGFAYVFLAGFYGALGCTLGSLVSYALGARGGRPLLERYGRWILIDRHDLAAADRWFARFGDAAVFVSRLLPVVRTFISFPAGVARMPLGRFTFYTFTGSFIWCVGLAAGGFYLGVHWERLRDAMRPFDIPVLVALGIAVVYYVYRRYRRAHLPEDE